MGFKLHNLANIPVFGLEKRQIQVQNVKHAFPLSMREASVVKHVVNN